MSLLAPIRIPEMSPEEWRYQAATMPTGFGEYLREKFWSGFDNSGIGRFFDNLFGHGERYGPRPHDTSREDAEAMGSAFDNRRLTEEEWRALKLDRPGLEYSGGGTVEYETARTRAYDDRRYRDSIIGRYQGGVPQYIAGFGAAMLGGGFSPENFIPFVGEGARAAMAARMGVIGGRVTAGVADAAIGTTLADVVALPDLARRGEDVGAADFALDLALGAVTGGLFGAWGGVRAYRAEGRARAAMLADTARAVRLDGVERLADALEVAQRALADDEPVDVGPVAAPADAALRRRLKVGTAAPPDARGFDVRGLPERDEKIGAPAPSSENPLARAILEEPQPDEWLVGAGIKFDGKIYSGPSHGDAVAAAMADGADEAKLSAFIENGDPENFVTSSGRIVTAGEALKIGRKASQVVGDSTAMDSVTSESFLFGKTWKDVQRARLEEGGFDATAAALLRSEPALAPAVESAARFPVDGQERVAAAGQGRPDLAAPFAERAPTGREAVNRFVTDYVTREAEAARHPSIVEAEASVGQAPPKTGIEEAQRLAKDMGLESPPELDDIKVLKRDGLLSAADEAELERAAETVKDANGWATAYETLSTCVLRYS